MPAASSAATGHAHLVQRGVRDDDPSSSSRNQYLDPFDVMGNGSARGERLPPLGVRLAAVGLGADGDAERDVPDRARGDRARSAVQLLEVPRLVGGPSYWLDFRQPFGELVRQLLRRPTRR